MNRSLNHQKPSISLLLMRKDDDQGILVLCNPNQGGSSPNIYSNYRSCIGWYAHYKYRILLLAHCSQVISIHLYSL